MKKFLVGALALSVLAGCSTNETTIELQKEGTISLKVWGSESDSEFLQKTIENFKKKYEQYDFDITLEYVSESVAGASVLKDVNSAADVFAFADDQTKTLVEGKGLLVLDDSVEAFLENIGTGTLTDVKDNNVSVSIASASYNDQLYAFPMSADNGYFLYYDGSVYSENDVKNWETLLSKAKDGKKVGMCLDSGWYNASFFYGAGFTTQLNNDGTTTLNWNSEVNGLKGSDVLLKMVKIANNDNFMALPSDKISDTILTGELCAVVSGTWDSENVKKVFGDNLRAAKMPKYTIGDEEYQTGSVIGSKLVGINPTSNNIGWSIIFAQYLTNEDSQLLHYEMTGIGPSNYTAQQNKEVKDDIALSALIEQNDYAYVQRVGSEYWTASTELGNSIVNGEINESNAQSTLDALVKKVG